MDRIAWRDRLESFTNADLDLELKAREARIGPEVKSTPSLPTPPPTTTAVVAEATAVGHGPPEANPELADIDSQILVEEIVARQKLIYNVDDRQEAEDITDARARRNSEAVVALFAAEKVADNGDGTSTLQTRSFALSQQLCGSERFGSQPVGCFCSGFLVRPDVVATAGHCVNEANVTDIRFVFGFRMQDGAPTLRIPNADIYRGTQLLGREEVSTGADWALVRLDRPAVGRPVVELREAGQLQEEDPVYIIGHPVGLPLKHAAGAQVRDASPSTHFVANLDSYGGNSGSPVFHAATHRVEGILALARGEADFRWIEQGPTVCRVSLVCPDTGCRGEDCTKISEALPTLLAEEE